MRYNEIKFLFMLYKGSHSIGGSKSRNEFALPLVDHVILGMTMSKLVPWSVSLSAATHSLTVKRLHSAGLSQ